MCYNLIIKTCGDQYVLTIEFDEMITNYDNNQDCNYDKN